MGGNLIGNLSDKYSQGFEDGATFMTETIMKEIGDSPLNNFKLMEKIERIYRETLVNIRRNS